jgi:hypothetical protein
VQSQFAGSGSLSRARRYALLLWLRSLVLSSYRMLAARWPHACSCSVQAADRSRRALVSCLQPAGHAACGRRVLQQVALACVTPAVTVCRRGIAFVCLTLRLAAVASLARASHACGRPAARLLSQFAGRRSLSHSHVRQQHVCSLSLQAADRSRVCGAVARRCGFARSCYGLVLAAGQQRSCSRSLPLSCAGR